MDRSLKGAASTTTMLHVSEQYQFHMNSRRNLKGQYTGDEEEAEESSSALDKEYLGQTAQHVSHQLKKIRSGSSQDTIVIRIGDNDSHVEPDSGASANVMDEYHFKALKHRSQEILVKGQSDLEVKIKSSATLQNKSCGTKTKFLVIQGKVDSPLLTSKSRLFEQRMSRIDPEETEQ